MNDVKRLLEQSVNAGIGSGMAAAWGDLNSLEKGYHHSVFVGTESHQSPIAIDQHSIFDLASLTKILATTSLYMKWEEQGKISLLDPYPGRSFTFQQLLTHSSGLTWWKPFYESLITRYGDAEKLVTVPIVERKKCLYDLVLQEQPENPPGQKIVYSDLGPLLLSYYAEFINPGKSFDQIVGEEVWDGIQQCGLHFRPIAMRERSDGVVATEVCPWRGWLQGEVHDDNCWSMGGVSGHSGVFGSLTDVVTWVRDLTAGKLVSYQTLRKFSQPVHDLSGNRRAIGFDMPSLDGMGSTAKVFSTSSIGHLGFTGTSIWIDLDQGRFAVLLTNRVHPSRSDNRIRDLRPMFHKVAFK